MVAPRDAQSPYPPNCNHHADPPPAKSLSDIILTPLSPFTASPNHVKCAVSGCTHIARDARGRLTPEGCVHDPSSTDRQSHRRVLAHRADGRHRDHRAAHRDLPPDPLAGAEPG